VAAVVVAPVVVAQPVVAVAQPLPLFDSRATEWHWFWT